MLSAAWLAARWANQIEKVNKVRKMLVFVGFQRRRFVAWPAFTATVFGRSKSFALDTISKHTLGTFSGYFWLVF